MRELNLDAIRERANAATPGPWKLIDCSCSSFTGYTIIGSDWTTVAGNFDYEDGGICTTGDAHFILAAREDVPALIAEVERLRSGAAERPRRGDPAEVWIKARRDAYPVGDPSWTALDDLLDDYREHADTGTPLTDAVRGQHEETR